MRRSWHSTGRQFAASVSDACLIPPLLALSLLTVARAAEVAFFERMDSDAPAAAYQLSIMQRRTQVVPHGRQINFHRSSILFRGEGRRNGVA